ncbi:MAG: hypothetical protein C0498_13550 [Anaerolinea sp.]|nr:hypothetical protein [Anaerolinea sp.]
MGCWDGSGSTRYAERAGATAFGIEIDATQAALARDRGMEVAEVDLEQERFPWPDGHFDVVVANQVLEHLKNVWLPLSEMWRVLAPDGRLVLSVPNLASLHNRLLLGLGRQPTSIRTIGPHVRGFTQREFRNLVALGDALEVIAVRGVGFYPLPITIARLAARVWPGASHTTVVLARRGQGTPVWRERTSAAAGQTHWAE